MRGNGFTLIEVVLALALTALVITGVTGGLLLTDRNLSETAGLVKARLMAGECLAVTRWMRDAVGPDELAAGTYGLTDDDGSWAFTEEPDVDGQHTRTVVITDESGSLKDVDCRIDWESGGRPASLSFSTVLAP